MAKRKQRASQGADIETDRIRWAVVGQGYFAQTAVLPAFAQAAENCELVALFSDDEAKRNQLRKRHGVPFALPYEEFDDFLRSGEVQAVYLAVPNHRHHEFTLRAAKAGVHVLCEKPMAVTSRECRAMIRVCEESRVKLMIAYRLHFEEANMTAVERIQKGAIGDPRFFVSTFSFPVREDNIRTMPTSEGGGPLYDIGIYCINAARYLFRAEPTEVVSFSGRAPGDDPRFRQTHEQVSAVLRFPGDRLATFTASFGAIDISTYTVAGTKGSLTLDPAYTHTTSFTLREEIQGRERHRKFERKDQVAPQLVYFATCIVEKQEPEPSGWEGFHDVRIIEAILESARTGRKVELRFEERPQRPSKRLVLGKAPIEKPPEMIRAEAPRRS